MPPTPRPRTGLELGGSHSSALSVRLSPVRITEKLIIRTLWDGSGLRRVSIRCRESHLARVALLLFPGREGAGCDSIARDEGPGHR